MEKYLRNKFKFYGLKSPERRKSYHDLIKAEKKNKKFDKNTRGKDQGKSNKSSKKVNINKNFKMMKKD